MMKTSHSRTLYDKIWQQHLIKDYPDGMSLVYVDRHLIHEVTSPQAFEGLRLAGRKVRRPRQSLAVVDHAVPTNSNRAQEIEEPSSRLQVATLEKNCQDFDVRLFGVRDIRQGIVHVIGPEQGFTLPGTIVVCGDSHTATHGAFGALAFGIGTSEVEHVLATQALLQRRSKTMRITIDGALAHGVTSKDVILSIIGMIGTGGGTGYTIEYAGSVISDLSVEARMTICNMSIEGGARAGLMAPDSKVWNFLRGRPMSPSGADFDQAVRRWELLFSDLGAAFDQEIRLAGAEIPPVVTWGNSPEHVVPVTGNVPRAEDQQNQAKREAYRRALEYMGLAGGEKITDIPIDTVFIGSCTNGRIEDLRSVAQFLEGRKLHNDVTGIVVPGSGLVRAQAEKEGLHQIFMNAGLEWRQAGCSMCLAMNPDKLSPGERCASTSNRNFEGRQGRGGRTHLVSPIMAAAAAVTGRFVDVRDRSAF